MRISTFVAVATTLVLTGTAVSFVGKREEQTHDVSGAVPRVEAFGSAHERGRDASRKRPAEHSNEGLDASPPYAVRPDVDGPGDEFIGSAVPSSSPPDPVEHERRLHVYRADLDRLLAAETVDKNWALETTWALEESMSTVQDDAVRLARLDCRTTLCKVEISVGPSRDAMAVMDQVAGKPGFRLPGFAHLIHEPDGKQTVHVYLARQNGVLPAFDG